MASEEDVKQRLIIEARARNISHNVRCTECGSQSIEDSQADVAILLRKLIHYEVRAGKSDKEIYKKLEDDFGEKVLYAPKFDIQTAGLWLSPVIVGGVAAGIWALQKHRQRTNTHIMALNLVRGVPLTPGERDTILTSLYRLCQQGGGGGLASDVHVLSMQDKTDEAFSAGTRWDFRLLRVFGRM